MDVLLGNAKMLEELPRRVREASRRGASFVGWYVLDRSLEADVRLVPVEETNQLIAKRIGGHERDILHNVKCGPAQAGHYVPQRDPAEAGHYVPQRRPAEAGHYALH